MARLLFIPALALILSSSSCCLIAPPVTTPGQEPALHSSTYTSFDGDEFPYQQWLPSSGEVQLVVIGFHGIAGASDDFRNLALHLQTTNLSAALYAPDQRGQGRDPLKSRRGDLHHPSEWFYDAHTFTRLVKKRHPQARIIWCGESMGSLIALHALNNPPTDLPLCDALILASPVIHISPRHLPPPKRLLLGVAAAIMPQAYFSLESLSGEQKTHVTRDAVHQEQVTRNPWHLSRFTLRFLSHLETLIDAMPEQASRTSLPVLILHGGKDVFSDPEDISAFEKAFPPEASITRLFYPESYHLLFYDHEREHIVGDTTRWLRALLKR